MRSTVYIFKLVKRLQTAANAKSRKLQQSWVQSQYLLRSADESVLNKGLYKLNKGLYKLKKGLYKKNPLFLMPERRYSSEGQQNTYSKRRGKKKKQIKIATNKYLGNRVQYGIGGHSRNTYRIPCKESPFVPYVLHLYRKFSICTVSSRKIVEL